MTKELYHRDLEKYVDNTYSQDIDAKKARLVSSFDSRFCGKTKEWALEQCVMYAIANSGLISSNVVSHIVRLCGEEFTLAGFVQYMKAGGKRFVSEQRCGLYKLTNFDRNAKYYYSRDEKNHVKV